MQALEVDAVAIRASLSSSGMATYVDIVLGDGLIQIFTLPDRRPSASSSSPIKWMYQMDLECTLYNDNNATKSTGAAYRLLQRTPGAAGRALCLRKRSIVEGLINEAEWDLLREPLDKCVRMLTLVPVDTAVKAATVFGETEVSAALIKALGFDRPTEWDKSDGDEGEEDDETVEQRRDDGDDSDSGEHSGDRSEGEASVAATEQFDYLSESDAGANDGGEANDAVPSSSQEGGGCHQQDKKKARVTSYTLVDVPASLQRELDAFTEWRIKPINRDRDGVCVQPITAAGNKADTLRLLGWLKSEHNVVPSIGAVFGSKRLGVAVQRYVDYLRECGRVFTTCAGYVKSFLAVARFVYSMRLARAPHGTPVTSGPVDAMVRAYRQIAQQASLEQRFTRKPKAWLDWSQIISARARAVREYDHYKDEDGTSGHQRLFDATLLVWLTSVPPDRVAVTRKLQLGVTLVPTADGGFDLDLSTPDAHKTAALFGPSTSPVPTPACRMLNAWVAAAGLSAASKPYIFTLASRDHSSSQHAEPFDTKQWTKIVQSVLARHAGTPVAPKDLRSSFITFMMSDANTNEELKKSVAFAMRHSVRQQAMPAYNKQIAERMWAAAVQLAGEYSERF